MRSVEEVREKVVSLEKGFHDLKQIITKMDTVAIKQGEIPNKLDILEDEVREIKTTTELVMEKMASQIETLEQKLQLQERFMQTLAMRLNAVEGKSAEAEDTTNIKTLTRSIKKVKEETPILHRQQDKILRQLVDEEKQKEVKMRTLRRHPSLKGNARWSFPLSPIRLDNIIVPNDKQITPTASQDTVTMVTKATPTGDKPVTDRDRQSSVVSTQHRLPSEDNKLSKLHQKQN